MNEFRRWKGQQLKSDGPSVGQILLTLCLWLSGALAAVLLMVLLLVTG